MHCKTDSFIENLDVSSCCPPPLPNIIIRKTFDGNANVSQLDQLNIDPQVSKSTAIGTGPL